MLHGRKGDLSASTNKSAFNSLNLNFEYSYMKMFAKAIGNNTGKKSRRVQVTLLKT